MTQRLLALLIFILPWEYKYRNLFRGLARACRPAEFPLWLDPRFSFYPSDLLALLLLGLALYATRTLWTRREALYPLLFFGAVSFSLTLSPFGSSPVVLFRLFPLLCPIALYYALATNGLSSPTLFRAFCFVGLFESAVALIQYFTQAPLGLRFLMEPQSLRELAILRVPDGHRWIFDGISQAALLPILRAAGTLPHPNPFGGFLLLSLIAHFPLLHSASTKKIFTFYSATFLFTFFAFCLSYSRSALYAFFLILPLWYFKSSPWTPRHRHLAFLILGAFCLSALLLGEQYWHRGTLLHSTALSTGADIERAALNRNALLLIQAHPFFGIGHTLFQTFSPSMGIVHNIYLLIAGENGVFALLLFLLFIGHLSLRALRTKLTLAGTAHLCMFSGLLAIGFVEFSPYYVHALRMALFLSAGLLTHELKESRAIALSMIR